MFVALNSGFYNSLGVGWSASLSSSSSTTSIMSTFPKEYTCFLFLRLVGERRFESQQNSQRICKTATRRLWIKTCKNLLCTRDIFYEVSITFENNTFWLPTLSCFVTVMTYRWGPQAPYLAPPVVFPYPGDIFRHTIREVPLPRKSL